MVTETQLLRSQPMMKRFEFLLVQSSSQVSYVVFVLFDYPSDQQKIYVSIQAMTVLSMTSAEYSVDSKGLRSPEKDGAEY